MNTKSSMAAYGALICALYVILTLISNAFGLSSGAIQVRLSEALTILPLFTPAAVPGLFAGCLISNLLTGCIPGDILLGSLATLIGALGTRALRKHPYLSPASPVAANTIIVPLVLSYLYHIPKALPVLCALVGAGEVISCWILGLLLYRILLPKRHILFK